MVDTRQTRRRLLQTAGVAIGSSIVVGTASADHEETWTFNADLSGEGHGIETPASGRATFEIPPDDHQIHYTIDAEWLCYGTQAHIHLGEEGEDGPVVAWLYPEEGQEPETIEGRFDGTLAEGSLTADDLVGPLEGADLGEIVSALIDGDAYVNVHTEEHPGGEIRGQIRPDAETEEFIQAAQEEAEEGESEAEDEAGDTDPDGEDEESEEESEEEEEEEESEEGGGEGMNGDGEDEEDESVTSASEAAGMLEVVDMNVDAGRDTDEEWVQFENAGDVPLNMSGWTVTDREEGGTGSVYEFQDFILDVGARVQLVTGDGSNTDDTVYWGLGAPRWNQNGDIIVVLDANGDEVLAHEYGDQATSIRGIFGSIRALFA